MKLAENQNIEYKVSWRDEYLKWVCGFANASGGSIYIGVDDNKNIVGINEAEKLLVDIPNKIVNYLGIVADVNLLKEEDKEYIEIKVSPSNVPISLKGIYHFRSGATKQELKGVALQQFILKKMGRTWDDIANEAATLDDIDSNAIEYFLRKAVNAKRMSSDSLGDTIEKVLENLDLYNEYHQIKNAAILLFGKRPSKFFPCVQFKIGRFGRDNTDLLFQDIVEGNIIQMTDRVIEILKSKYLISPIYYEGLQRIEPLEIPEEALREAIFNAIIHKDYTGVHIQMKVYNDRIILWNEGKLIDNYTVETLLNDHSSHPRNKNIANVFYKAGFIEAWGRGISKIRTGFIDAKLPEPLFEEKMGGMWVSIPRNVGIKQENVGINEDDVGIIQENVGINENDVGIIQENVGINENDVGIIQENVGINDKIKFEILKKISENPSLSAKELSNLLNINDRTVERYVKQLKESGMIERIGSKKTGYWKILKELDTNYE